MAHAVTTGFRAERANVALPTELLAAPIDDFCDEERQSDGTPPLPGHVAWLRSFAAVWPFRDALYRLN